MPWTVDALTGTHNELGLGSGETAVSDRGSGVPAVESVTLKPPQDCAYLTDCHPGYGIAWSEEDSRP